MPANWLIRDKLLALGRAVYDYIYPPRRGLPTEVVNEDEAKNERFKMNLVRWLRISIFIALSLAAALLGYFAYTTFSDAEQDSFKREFSSSAVLIEDNLRAAFQDIERTALEQAAIFTYRFPDESQWPNITFPNYAKVFKAQLNGTNARGMTFSPLIDARTNRKTWEAYAARAYKSLDLPASIRASLASWPPSKGIYDLPFGQDGRKVYSVVPIPGSRYPYLLVPTWQTIPRIYSTFLMFNLHANGPRMLTIGQAVKARKPALSDFLALLIDPVTVIRPSSIMYAPIIGFHDRKKVLGMTSLFFSWDSLLSGSLPSFIDGIECVIMSSSSLTSYTFSISGSNVAIESIGDAHNSKYNHLRNMFSIQIDAAQEFFFSIYPTQTLENKYKTKTPLYCLIIVLSSIGGTVVALIMYKRAVLDLEVFNGENERVMTIKRKSDAEMARVVDDVASPMLALDVQGQILIWNRALVIMFGIEKEEALKLNFMTTFVHADYIEKAQSVLNKAFERKVGTLNFELKLRYRDGPSHLLLISATPLKGLSTEVRRVLFVTSNDITKLEETRRSVRKAEAEAEYTNFLAHEVRNPLTGIDSSAQNLTAAIQSLINLKETPSIERIYTLLNECEEETKHTRTCVGYISQVLDNSLDVSKIEISLHEVLVQSDVIDPSVFMLLSQIPKDLQVVVSCDRKVYVMGNILRLQQIMLNILTNALKFAKTGKVEILVSLIATGTVKIEVRDEGPGIAAEHRGKLFSKYGQVEVRQGTGLGLSLCSKFIEAMNGRLYLDAEYARGASFVIEMPGGRSKSIVSRPPSLVLTESNKVDEKYVPFNLVVLLVDDSKAATKLLRRRIENCSDRAKSWDLQVVARTGEEAIKICRGNKGSFDIVIMDQNMQAAGGFLLGHETIRIMREELNMHRTVMVGCSGNAETCDTLFIEAGADGVWTKPTPPTVNMILDLCRFRYSRINEYAAGLPGMVNVLLVENCDFLPDLPVDVPPSWCFHRLICTRDAINEKLSICQIAIVVDETLSSLSTVEAVKLIHGSAHFTGFTILCVDDPEVERRASKYATLVLQKKGLSVGEMLLSLSLLLSK